MNGLCKTGFFLSLALGIAVTSPWANPQSGPGALNISGGLFANPGTLQTFTGCPGGVTLASGDERMLSASDFLQVKNDASNPRTATRREYP